MKHIYINFSWKSGQNWFFLQIQAPLILKNICKLMSLSHHLNFKIFIYYVIFMYFCVKHLYSNVGLKWWQNLNKKCKCGVHTPKIWKSSFIIRFWWNFVCNILLRLLIVKIRTKIEIYLHKISDLDQILFETSLFDCKLG